MKCPKCNHDMKEVDGVEFSAMKCSGCNGMWFRDGSIELARSIEGASTIDDEAHHSQAAYNEVRDIECPECHQGMMKMVDREQFHIEFEACRYCNGVFLDSGEFKDMTEFTLIERVKQAVDTLKYNLSQ